ncbi:hypothetical protein D3C77_558960 [compost metagenome]
MIEPGQQCPVHHRSGVAHPGAVMLEHTRRLTDRSKYLLAGFEADAGVEHQADFQALHRLPGQPPVTRQGRQAGGVAGIGPAQVAHHQGAVVQGTGHRPGAAAGVVRVDGNAPQGRLEADQPTPRSRQAYRATDVGTDVQRPVTRRCRCGGTRAGAAGVTVQVPRITRQAMQARQP